MSVWRIRAVGSHSDGQTEEYRPGYLKNIDDRVEGGKAVMIEKRDIPVICSIKALICLEDTVAFNPPSDSSSRSSDIFQASAEEIISLI